MGLNNSSGQTIGRRYVLHEHLGTGGMGTVHRATDRLTGQTVALKRVTTRPEELTFASKASDSSHLIALATEFRTLASLRHPNIISVLDYGFDESRQPYFTMEYLPDAKTIIQAGKDLSRHEQVNLILEMLQALVYLHRRGILHRDLKPANVLVTQGHVKVVDFGLSVDSKTRSGGNSDATAGTLAYMAPELFNDVPVSRAADLYAVGVISYELFAGRHPFNINNIAVLLNEILNKQIDVKNIGLEEDLAAVLNNLLTKDKDIRSSDAGKAIIDLCQAAQLPLPMETEAIRESFLQTAKFVGRGTELAQLAHALNATLESHGSSYLVGGESGVGKSRLIEELRTLALVKGAVVLRGQAVSEGGRVYQIWRDMLPILCIHTDLDDLEASILKPLIPDIGDLLGRDIPDPPPIDPQSTQNRLFDLIIKLFQRQFQPMVLIFEDLHWAGSGSVALINHVSKVTPSLPLLLIGNYRNDESPDLPERIPGIQVIKLSRLDDASVTELSASILGETGREPQIVNLLQRETEGIPFYLIEVVRALAEEAGQLSQIGQMPLPEKILAGGIQQIVERRMNRVPEAARSLLQVAAVIGRELDLNVLQTIDPAMGLDEWLATCANAAVLDVQENRWRFAHDKLRERVLEELTASERPALHRRVAEAIEAVYPDATKYAVTLTYLWGIAGDTKKELYYAAAAGRQAVRDSAYEEGIRFLTHALELLSTLVDAQERARQELELLITLGPALHATKGFSAPEVKKTYARAVELCRHLGDTEHIFSAEWGFWLYHALGGEYKTARKLGEHLLTIAHDTSNRAYLMQAHHSMWATLFWPGDIIDSEAHTREGLALYDRKEHRSHIFLFGGHDACVCGLGFGSLSLWMLGYPDQAQQRSLAALQSAKELDHPHTSGLGLTYATILQQFRRDSLQVQGLAEKGIKLSNDHRFPQWLALEMILRGWAQVEEGGKEGIAQIHDGLARYATISAKWAQTYFLALLADAHRKLGQPEPALNILNEVLALIASGGERLWEAEAHRLKGELMLAQGEMTTEVEREFRVAIGFARQRNAKSLELRAVMSLCRLWQQEGRVSEAHNMLAAIYNWFTEGFDTADLLEAKELLNNLS